MVFAFSTRLLASDRLCLRLALFSFGFAFALCGDLFLLFPPQTKPPIYAKTLLTTASSLMRFYFIYFLISHLFSLFLRLTPITPPPSQCFIFLTLLDFRFRCSRVNVGNFCFYCGTSSAFFFLTPPAIMRHTFLNVICLLSSFVLLCHRLPLMLNILLVMARKLGWRRKNLAPNPLRPTF